MKLLAFCQQFSGSLHSVHKLQPNTWSEADKRDNRAAAINLFITLNLRKVKANT